MKKLLLFTRMKRSLRWFVHTRRRNKIFTIIGLVILVGFILSRVQAATAKPPYIIEKVSRGNITQIVSETGNVNTAGRADVFSAATGIVEEIYVDNGVTVSTGENLFHVRSTATPQEKASAYATYQNAISALKTAEQSKLTVDAQMWTAHQVLLDARNTVNYKNSNTENPSTGEGYTDLEKESINASAVQAEKNFQALEKKVKEADVAIVAAQAQVNSALLAMQATQDVVVTAPADGTVANLSVFIGDQVVAGTAASVATGLAATAAAPVLTIANLNNYSVRLSLNEVDIPKVRSGQKAEIILDAIDGKKFRGTISHVDEVGTNTQGVITYTVVANIDNPDPSIRPGMTASIDIAVDRVENVLTVPNNAVKPYKGGRAVRVVDPKSKELTFVPVKVGIKGESRTEIISGLKEGQEIVTALSNEQIKRPGLF